MKNRIKNFLIILSIIIVITSCGYTDEEKKYASELEKQANKNAINYIKEKYEVDANVVSVELEYPEFGVVPNFFPSPTGNAIVSLKYQNKTFEVYITGKEVSNDGKDNYRMPEIINATLEYINNIIGLEPYSYAIYYGKYKNIHKHNGLISETYKEQNIEDIILNNNFDIVLEYINAKDLQYVKEQSLLSHMSNARLMLVNYNSLDSYKNVFSINNEPISTYNEEYLYENAINIQSAYGLSKFKEEYYNFDVKQTGNMQYIYINDDDNDVTIEATTDILVEKWIGKGACQDVKKIYKDFQVIGLSNKKGKLYIYIPVNDIKTIKQNDDIKVAIECGDELTTTYINKKGNYYLSNITLYACNSPDVKFTFMASECNDS